jgi:hypothetical protein
MNNRATSEKYDRHDAAQTKMFFIAMRRKLAVVAFRSGGCELSRHPSPSGPSTRRKNAPTWFKRSGYAAQARPS